MNACTICGFTTNNLNDFSLHIAEHEKTPRPSPASPLTLSVSQSSPDSGVSFGSSPDQIAQTAPATDNELGLASTMFATPPHPLAGFVAAAFAAVSENKFSPPKSMSPLMSLPMTPFPGTSPPESTTPTPKTDLDSPDSLRRQGKNEKVVHSCPHCNFTTVMSQHMKSHLDAHERHQGQMYQCDICKMQFSQKANMHRHRMRHSGVKPYECRYCLKKFFRKDQMQEHSMTHIKTGDSFDCPVAGCTNQFSQHSVLRTHLEEHHAISANQQASCKRCSLMFSNSRRLLLHYQTKHDEEKKHEAVLRRSLAKGKTQESFAESLKGIDLTSAFSILNNGGNPVSLLDDERFGEGAKKRRWNGTKKHNTKSAKALHDSSHAASLPDSTTPDFSPQPEENTGKGNENEDVVVDVCGLEGEKTSASTTSVNGEPLAKFPKTETNCCDKVIANGYKLQVPPASTTDLFMPFVNNFFNPFLMSQMKSDSVLWNQEQPLLRNTISAFSVGNGSTSAPDEIAGTATHSPSAESQSSTTSGEKEPLECEHCGIFFSDRTLHLLHKGLHSAQDPWKCNLCGIMCYDKYIFTSHMISSDHS